MTTVHEALNSLNRFRSEGRFRISAADAMGAALSGLPARSEPIVRHFSESNGVVRLDLVSANTTDYVAMNDVVEAGLTLCYAAKPQEGLSVWAYFNRLRCVNGLFQQDCGTPTRITRDERDSHLKVIERSAGELFNRLPTKLNELRLLTRARASVPVLLEESVRRAELAPRRVLPRLIQAWNEEEAVQSEWGALNALTRVSTHATDVRAEEREALGRIAGALAFRRRHSCHRCFPSLPSKKHELKREIHSFVLAALQASRNRDRWS